MDTITRILELAKQRGISQKHLCSLVGVSRTYLSMTKGRRTVPPEKYLRVWAQELRTSLDYLQCKTDDPSPEALLGNEKEPGIMARLSPVKDELFRLLSALPDDLAPDALEYLRQLNAAQAPSDTGSDAAGSPD